MENRLLQALKMVYVFTLHGTSKSSPGQLSFPLPWDLYQVSENPDVKAVAKKFVNANGYNTKFA
jgi:hypothetical protein